MHNQLRKLASNGLMMYLLYKHFKQKGEVQYIRTKVKGMDIYFNRKLNRTSIV